ncbi:MAG: amidohydrolase family protein [Chloroflexi bacterium]|nr:amidohydrolase family protein [Chloroflexota bacterium]
MPASNNRFKLIKAGRLLDCAGGPSVTDGAVLVDGHVISAVGRASEVRAPEGAEVEVFDYPGMTIMPGMVDCHTHNNGFGDGRPGDDVGEMPDEILMIQSARNLRASLFSGVTTVRENGPKNFTMFRMRDAINDGLAVGPRMTLCGRPISIIGGHMSYFGSVVTGAVEARAMTRQLIKEGADYIKVTATGGTTRTSFPLLPSFTVEELEAITDEAHRFGKLTGTHCISTQGTINSLDAGVDMIIHCGFLEADGTPNFREDVAERLGRQGAYINPTVHVGRARIWVLQNRKESEGLTPAEQDQLDDMLRANDVKLEHTRRMQEMGLRVITGSDSSWGDYQLGNTVNETECLVMAGYSSMQGVLSVTIEAARALDMDDVVGSLEPGKKADVIVVDGSPDENILDLWKIDEVFFNGERIDRGSEKSLASIRQQRPAEGP